MPGQRRLGYTWGTPGVTAGAAPSTSGTGVIPALAAATRVPRPWTMSLSCRSSGSILFLVLPSMDLANTSTNWRYLDRGIIPRTAYSCIRVRGHPSHLLSAAHTEYGVHTCSVRVRTRTCRRHMYNNGAAGVSRSRRRTPSWSSPVGPEEKDVPSSQGLVLRTPYGMESSPLPPTLVRLSNACQENLTATCIFTSTNASPEPKRRQPYSEGPPKLRPGPNGRVRKEGCGTVSSRLRGFFSSGTGRGDGPPRD